MSTPSYDEKRKERRFPVSSDVKMMLANKRIVNGVCKNISGSGMLVRAEVVDDNHWLGLEVNKKLPS